MTASNLLYFLGASVALMVAPGPDNTFVVAQGNFPVGEEGRRCHRPRHVQRGQRPHNGRGPRHLRAPLFVRDRVSDPEVRRSRLPPVPCLEIAEGAAGPASPGHCGRTELLAPFPARVYHERHQPQGGALLPGIPSPVRLPRPETAAVQMFVLGLLFMAQAVVVFSVIGWLSGKHRRCRGEKTPHRPLVRPADRRRLCFPGDTACPG